MFNILKNYRCGYSLTLSSKILVLIIFSLLTQTVEAKNIDKQGCKCHQKMVKKSLEKIYVHSPFKEIGCNTCHSKKAEDEAELSAYGSKIPEKINWLFESLTPATTHSFLIPIMNRGNSLYIETGEQGRHLHRKKIYPFLHLSHCP